MKGLSGGRGENFIVRIYRRDSKNPSDIVGIVEDAAGEGKAAFRDLEELLAILSVKAGATRASWKGRNSISAKAGLQVLVKGKDSTGRSFSEKATLVDVSPVEGLISLKAGVREGAEISLFTGPSRAWIKATVVRQRTGCAGCVGVAFGGARPKIK